MGGAVMIGPRPRARANRSCRVRVVTGDGEMLMAWGRSPPWRCRHPKNLAIVVFRQERAGELWVEAHPPPVSALTWPASRPGTANSALVRSKVELDAAQAGL